MLPFQPKAVIFDFDGVLLNSISIHKNAWHDAYDTLFSEPFPTVDPSSLSGQSSRVIAEHIATAGGHVNSGEQLLSLKNRILNQLHFPPLVNGAREIVDHLKSKGIPYGICSNAQSYFIEQVTVQNGFSFPVIIGFDNTPKPKPAPDGYIEVAKLLGIAPEEFHHIVVFEDSPTGIAAAVQAGMFAFGIEYLHSAKELRSYGAQETIKDLEALWYSNPFFTEL